MLSYGLFFYLAGLAIRDTARTRGWQRLADLGVVVPFLALAAATFDASENVALLLTLAGSGGSFAAPFAAVCSAVKFTLIGLAILYVLAGLVLRLRARSPAAKLIAESVASDSATVARGGIELDR